MTTAIFPDAFLSPLVIDEAINRALAEDLGRAGDITSVATVPAHLSGRAVVAARQADGPYTSMEDLARRVPVDRGTLEALATAGAIGGTHGSPIPPAWAPDRTNSTLISGASAR